MKIQAINNNRILFTALNEALHSTYLKSSAVKGYDANLATKIHNMKAQLERQLKADFLFIEEKGGDPVLDIFYKLVNVLEGLIEAADRGDAAYFETLILMLDAYRNGAKEIYESEKVLPNGAMLELKRKLNE